MLAELRENMQLTVIESCPIFSCKSSHWMTEARYKEAVSHKTLSLKLLSVGSLLWQINAVLQKEKKKKLIRCSDKKKKTCGVLKFVIPINGCSWGGVVRAAILRYIYTVRECLNCNKSGNLALNSLSAGCSFKLLKSWARRNLPDNAAFLFARAPCFVCLRSERRTQLIFYIKVGRKVLGNAAYEKKKYMCIPFCGC